MSSANERQFHGSEVAIIGMVARFPKSNSLEEFWEILRNGKEGISHFSDEEVQREGRGANLARRNFVKAGGVLQGYDLFDAAFFGFSPHEAKITDPQHRVFLETTWEALETAGYNPDTYGGSIGVYAGVGMNTYLFNLYGSPEGIRTMQRVGDFRVILGNGKDHLPTWASYTLNLKGPSVSVNTACSTSLVAVHVACQSLLSGECDLALAGGITVDAQHGSGYFYQEGGILSPDGHCRAFDADSAGTVGSSGVGLVVLKRLSEALADGDHIHAILKGTAINNDGSSKAGYTAPSIEGQSRVIREALEVAEVSAETISYVEAHGTGTEIGDPIEITALTSAFRASTDAKRFCAVGTVKSNIGHVDTAAGIAGLIKTALSLEHRMIPPSLHFKRPNPRIDFENSPFFVNAELRSWETNGVPRRAGVSSFGMGGTNAHVIVEEPPSWEASGPARPWQLLVLSAKTEAALEAATDRLIAHLERHPDLSFADAAYTLQIGRKAFAHRRCLVCRDRDEALEALETRDPRRVLTLAEPPRHRPVAFLFPGQGAQHAGMGRGLYETEPAFREHVDRCAQILAAPLGLDLREVLFPLAGGEDAAAARLQQTALAQPALFVIEHAMARLWMEWGIEPEAMIGHSIGEYVAACLAGVFTLEDGLRLVAARGRLMQSLPEGAMLAVHLGEDRLLPLLGPDLSLAALNAPGLAVVSGPFAAVEDLERRLGEQGVKARRLHTSHAFHSSMMDPVLYAFEAELAGVSLAPPRLPFVSNLTGTWITAEQATSPSYWVRHLRQAVRFADGARELLADPARILLEVGPGRTLTTFARQGLGPADRLLLTSLPHPRDQGSELSDLLLSLGRLWLAGVLPDWSGFHRHEIRRRVHLPTYPFERKRYWIERAISGDEGVGHEAPGAGAEPDAEAPDRPLTAVSPADLANDIERRIAAVWKEFLGLEEIGPHDNFFELGGHSLLLIEVVARLREELSVDLPMRSAIECPTVSELAELISGSLGTAQEAPVIDALPVLTPDPGHLFEPFPLTEVQEAYWIGRSGLFDLGNVATHQYFELPAGRIDLTRLTLALQRLIDRHVMLRAVILADGRQRILDEVPPYEIAVLDLRGREPQQARADLEALRERMSHQIMPADRWPLFEIRMTYLSEARSLLHVSIDMLIADAWSIQILHQELVQLYFDRHAALRPMDLSFRDYVLAEVAFRGSDAYRRALDYWQARLPTLPGPPELPLARTPASLTTPRFVRHHAYLERSAWSRLKAKSSQVGLMPSGVLLAAYADVLTAWSKSPHFLLNLTLFNRLPFHPHVDRVVGDFTSLTLVEVDNSVPATFTQRALRLQDRLWQDLEHRYVSGVRVLRDLMREKGGRLRTLAPVVFTSTLFMTAGESAAGAEDGPAPGFDDHGISQTPQVWLDLGIGERAGYLTFSWDVVEDLFPPGLLNDMFTAYRDLLARLADDEGAWEQVARSLIPAAQLAARAAVNATAAPLPASTLQGLFTAQAAQRPEQPAVITPERTLTYGELARLSNRAGRGLRGLGARPNRLVAVVMDKGWEQVAAVLAVLHSGAAYLPIDPNVPADRLDYLLRQGEVELVLTQPAWLDALRWPPEVRPLTLDGDWLVGVPDEPLAPVQGARDLAYVIFTSGSTGLPKGVMIDHQGAVNTILDVNERFSIGPEDRVLALSALNFDLSVYDVFGLLAAGGAVVLPATAASKEPAQWAALASSARVTVWNSVPALLSMLVDSVAGTPPPIPGLRLALLSGDWIPTGLPGRVRALWPQARVISLGGATEASIWSILYPVDDVDPGWASIPYGKPMVSQSFQVLDCALEPCPVWVPGNLYIGGAGLAQGYWRDGARTAASFVPHPVTGERLYRTGDLGRYLPDGNIEFLGREDFQVKVQGYRIELGEIEATLALHPRIEAAVVTVAGDPRGEKRLVAYVVPAGAHESGPAVEVPAEPAGPAAGVLVHDPIERLRFKTRQHGLRHDLGEEGLDLAGGPLGEDRLRAYTQRRSHRRFLAGTPSFAAISELLGCLRQADLNGRPKYRYPSAGSLYPVQVYLFVKEDRGGSVPGGTYYYHPGDHRLILLSPGAHIDSRLFGDENAPVFEQSAFGLFLIADLDAIAPLYGDRARDFCLLEAGYMGQVLMTSAPAADLGLCPIGGLDFASLRGLFSLTGRHELVHVLLGGQVDPVEAREAEGEDYGTFLRLLEEEVGAGGPPRGSREPAAATAAPRTRVVREPLRADAGDAGLAGELRAFARTKLPEYMVPTTILVLPALPLTANGKVDRRALPQPEGEPEPRKEHVAPRNELEVEVAALWSEVLGRERIGIRDDFFEAGGHSLLAARLVARVREQFRVELPLASIFEAPDVAGMAAAIARRRAAAGSTSAAAEPAGPALVPDPAQAGEPFPLTDLQQAYWLGGTGAFSLGNLPPQFSLDLEVPGLSVARLEEALQRLIARHGMLRAVVEADGRQRILPAPEPYRIELVDLLGLAPAAREEALREVRERVTRQVAATDRWPLFDVRVCRVDDGLFHLCIGINLLICDAWSSGIFAGELARLYADPAAALPPLELSFRDYVLAAGAFEESPSYQRSLEFWRERLPTLPPAPELPLVRAPEMAEHPGFVRRTGRLEPELWNRFKQRATASGVTADAALCTVYAEILARWSKRRHFTLNLLAFNRLPLHPDVGAILANFSSTVLLEVGASRGQTFEAEARILQEQLWHGLEHSQVSGVRVLRELQRLRGRAAETLMPVVFASTVSLQRSQPGGSGSSSGAGPAALGRVLESRLQTPQVWLDHQVHEDAAALVFHWDSVDALFPPGLVGSMFAAYVRLLEHLSADETVWRRPLPSLVPAEQLARRAAANATEGPLPDRLLHAPLAARAAERPAEPAVISGRRTLTYGELNGRANHLGRRLREAGVLPDTLVGVVMEKGWEQVVATFGTLASGAAYLPLDPELPSERLLYLLRQGEVEVALAQPWVAEQVEWPENVRVLVVDADPEAIDERPLEPVQTLENLAYVTFTSGSTGLPKGVMIDHRGAVNTIEDINRRFGMGPSDRVLALSSLSFDLSVWDVFGMIAAGGAVVLPEPAALREPALWAEQAERHGVTIWNSVPALLQMFVDHLAGRGESLPHALRLALLSGDWIPVTLPGGVAALREDVEVVSLGGATEASIWSIVHPIDRVDPEWASIPYGRPLTNQRFHVLNEALEPCPDWVPGQLYIGGIGLARGYWRDPAKTDASFVVHLLTGERLYSTGDLGRYLPDGTIEFLGREDLQVKIQGYRIELGEIESVLARHPRVRACAAVAVGQTRGNKSLALFAVLDAPEAATVEELRLFLSGRLPAYMVPHTIHLLGELPLTANGKVDRGALERAGDARPEPVAFVPPRDELERQLAGLWEEILDVQPIGITASFFDLGGHSLAAVRLMAGLRRMLGRDLPLATLFRADTIEKLAEVLRQEAHPLHRVLVPIQAQGTRLPVFWVHPVGGSVLAYAELARALGADQPFFGLQTPEGEDGSPPRIEEMAALYIAALRAAQPHGPYRLAGWSMGGVVAYEMARQLTAAGEEVERVILLDSEVPGHGGDPTDADDEADLAVWFARDLGGLAGQGLELTAEELRAVPPAERIAVLLERARAAGVLPPDIAPDHLQHHFDVFKVNARALAAHAPGPYAGRIFLLRAAETWEDGVEHALGWGGLAQGGVDVRKVPGNHYTVVQRPHVETLAEQLHEILAT